jgi:hypothetical protein
MAQRNGQERIDHIKQIQDNRTEEMRDRRRAKEKEKRYKPDDDEINGKKFAIKKTPGL